MTDTLTRPSAIATEYRACRLCGAEQLATVLDLGAQAISDFYRVVPIDEPRAPLCLVQCGQCGLVQLSHSVEKDRLYRAYWYQSGINEKMVAALQNVADDAQRWVTLEAHDIVVDIGANDWTLLDAYPDFVRRIGIDPSNIRPKEVRMGDIVVQGYFPFSQKRLYGDLVGQAKVVTAIAVFYDTDDPNAFIDGIRRILHPDGVFVCQMMDLDAMLHFNAIDNVCAEHVGYWSIRNFHDLIARHGLRLVAASRNDVNGGSVRLVVKHGVDPILEKGSATDIYADDIRDFAQRVEHEKAACLAFLEQCRREGKTVLGYGASTKFNTLAQYYGITRDHIPAFAERSPEKWGRVTAGAHIPIISEEEARRQKPDYFFIGPWAFLDAFLVRERAYLEQGGKFIVPLPEFRVVGL